MKVLLLGGAGHVGSFISPYLTPTHRLHNPGLRAVATRPSTTLYLLSSKSGTTIEPNSLAAHFEFTVAVTVDGPRVLTPWHLPAEERAAESLLEGLAGAG